MSEKNCNKPTPNVQVGKMSEEELETAKWFLDDEWHRAKKYDNFSFYHSSLGWIFYNALISKDQPVLAVAMVALEILKEKNPEAYQNFMTTCKERFEKNKPESPGDIVPSPTTGDTHE